MAIIYPLSLPAVSAPARISLFARNIVGVSESPFTFSQQTFQHQGQRWEASIEMPPMFGDDAERWVAFLLSLGGRWGTFIMGDPANKVPRGLVTGVPLVNGAGQTGQTLNTDGWTGNTTGILKAGDYIQLGSGSTSRLHKVLQDANSNSSGQAALEIWPRLRSATNDDAIITVQNTVGLWRLSENVTDWNIGLAKIYGFSFSATEAL